MALIDNSVVVEVANPKVTRWQYPHLTRSKIPQTPSLHRQHQPVVQAANNSPHRQHRQNGIARFDHAQVMGQPCDAIPTSRSQRPAKQYGHQHARKHTFAMGHGKEPRDSIRKQKADTRRQPVRQLRRHNLLYLRISLGP